MKKDTAIVDMDGVVVKCDELIVADINKKYGTNFTVEDIGTYGPTGNPILDKKFEYYKDPSFVYSQTPYDGAQNFVEELKKRCDVVFCTAVDPNCLTVRSAEAQKDFNMDAGQIMTCRRKDLVVAKFFIDDSPYNIKRSNCEYPILFRRPWNHEVSGCMSVTKYEDILCFVDFIQNRKELTRVPQNAIVCLVGPTGAGKTEMASDLVAKGYKRIRTLKGVYKATDPNYIGEESFRQMEANGLFAETTVYGGVKYGISKEAIAAIGANDKAVVCVDICGAMALKNIFGDRAVMVFCDVNKEQSIMNLLKKDISDAEKVIRINGLDAELEAKKFCDFKVSGLNELLMSI